MCGGLECRVERRQIEITAKKETLKLSACDSKNLNFMSFIDIYYFRLVIEPDGQLNTFRESFASVSC